MIGTSLLLANPNSGQYITIGPCITKGLHSSLYDDLLYVDSGYCHCNRSCIVIHDKYQVDMASMASHSVTRDLGMPLKCSRNRQLMDSTRTPFLKKIYCIAV